MDKLIIDLSKDRNNAEHIRIEPMTSEEIESILVATVAFDEEMEKQKKKKEDNIKTIEKIANETNIDLDELKKLFNYNNLAATEESKKVKI